MNQTRRSILGIITAISLSSLSFLSHGEEIGSVDTVFKILGPDHKIVVEAFDDPDVENITCYLSRAKTGGISGGLGLAEDTSDAAISCQQVGPVTVSDKVKKAAKIKARWCSRSGHPWYSRSYRWFVSMMRSVTR